MYYYSSVLPGGFCTVLPIPAGHGFLYFGADFFLARTFLFWSSSPRASFLFTALDFPSCPFFLRYFGTGRPVTNNSVWKFGYLFIFTTKTKSDTPQQRAPPPVDQIGMGEFSVATRNEYSGGEGTRERSAGSLFFFLFWDSGVRLMFLYH